MKSRSITRPVLLGLSSLLISPSLSAAVWTGAIDNNWSNGDNWDTYTTPGVDENITVNSGTVSMPNPSRTGTGTNTFEGTARVEAAADTHWNLTGAGATLLKDNATLVMTRSGADGNARFQNAGLLTIQDNASLSVTGQYFIVGFNTRSGQIVQNGGNVTANLSRGFLVSDNAAAANSSYTLNNGSISVTQTNSSTTDANRQLYGVWLGKVANSADFLTINGGTASFSSTTGASNVTVANGSQMIVTGGVTTFHNYYQFQVGVVNSTSHLSVSGGELNITGGTNLILGQSAAGNFNLSGGSVTLGGILQLGTASHAGNVSMSNGSLFVEEIQATNGIFEYTGGTLTIRGNHEGITDELWFDSTGASEAVTAWYDADNNWTVIGGAIPEPSALLLIGLVAPLLGLRRRAQA